MAAKPPAKPPGNFLKQLNDCINNGNNTTAKIFNKLSAHIKKNDTENIGNSSCNLSGSSNSIASDSNTNLVNAINNINVNGNINDDLITNIATASSSQATIKSNCNCTNISIMHLFHEMKQEFPTIPDTIVAQCVNENCHQRENCIQQLKNELALHPIPAQSYPAKVLHPPTQQQQQKQLCNISGAALSTSNTASLKPFRPAPLQPPFKTELGSFSQKQNCDSVKIKNNISAKSPCLVRKDVQNIREEAISDMPVTSFKNNNINCVADTHSSNENRENVNPHDIQNATLPPPPPTITPRMRPTTLNLQQQQNQNLQQRQQINIQLQKHFQQRQQTKPLRKAPLPPIPPKPVQYINAGAHSPQFHHSKNNINKNNNNINGNHNLANFQQSSLSNDSNLTSPTSSVGESSEISVNVSLSSPIISTPTQSTVNTALRSPIRHRSVITVHPEPPYTRDFTSAASPTTSNSSTGTSSGAKSFTSVNLTLRQPNANSTVPASTIDISAGPGLSGNGGGLTYSSTTYDARLGYQKNFHITVTDEGGIFSASRIRPRSCFVPEAEHEIDNPNSPTSGGHLNPLHTASSEQCVSAQQQQPQQPNILAAYNKTSGEMCLQNGNNALIETLERQKARRDKLGSALRDNKRRLTQVRQEINVLKEPVRPGETERLDDEIRKLRCDCEAMLNEIDIARRSGPSLLSINNRQQPQPQPFPRQRLQRTTQTTTLTSTPINRQPQLDFIQHHITPRTPFSGAFTTNSTHQQAPLTYQEYLHQHQNNQQQQFIPSTDEEEYSDSVTDADDDDDNEEEPLEMWACNMCTFRNHPQLNICECCENVRIPPGTLRRIMPAGIAANITATQTSNNNNAGENDANLTQPQLQQFVLPT